MRSPLASPFRGGWRNLTPMRGRGRGGANPWTPAMLPPYAWYDAELGQPKNVGYVELDGASGDNIQTPDSAALSFSNDIEVVMRVRVTDWSTGSGQTLCGKYVSTGNQRSWRFYVSSTGSIGLSVSQDGTSSVTTVTVTPTVALADDAWVWLRMRLDLSNGTNSVGTLETAADTGDNVEPASWTANGTNTGTTIATVFDSTAALEIGAFAAGTLERLAGSVGRCIVRNGFGGTTVADFNADDCYGDGYWHTDGYRWTLGLPKIYDRSGNNHPPAVFGSGSNQPTWLPWTGISSLSSPLGNYVTWVGGDVPARFPGDWSVTWRGVRIVADGSFRGIVRRTTGGPNGWELRWNTAGDLEMVIGDGVSYFAGAISSAGSVPAGSWGWFRIEFVKNEGGVSKFKAWFAPDASVEPAVFTSLGVYSFASVVSIDYTASAAVVLQANTTAIPLSCLILRDAGAAVATFDAALCTQTGIAADAQGNTWLITRSTSGRKTVVQSPVANSARSVILLGTDDSETLNAGVMPPMTATTPASVLAVHRTWGTIASNSTILDTRATNAVVPGLSLRFSGETAFAVLVDSASSITTTTVAAAYGAKHVVGAVLDAANIYPVVDTTIGTASARTGNDETGTSTTLLNVRPGPVGYLDSEFFGVIAVSRALTATELGLISAYYGGGL